MVKNIVNLSDYTPDSDELAALSKGLKFCPTPGLSDPGESVEDMTRLHRRVRQIAYFENPEFANSQDDTVSADYLSPNINSTEPFKHRKFKLPSSGRGPPAPPTVEAMVRCNETDFINRQASTKPSKLNFSPKEKRAITKLRENPNIVIKPADKGGAIVILNRSDYLKEGFRQLSNTEFYTQLDHNPTDQYRTQVQNAIEDMYQNGEIDETVKDYLTDHQCKTSNFYMLPKIHKSIRPPPGRPILSANGSPTEKISAFVDHFINQYCPLVKSFVKDTTHFLQILNNLGPIPGDALLVTLDVSSLYTNIDSKAGLNVIKNLLNSERTRPDVAPTNRSLLGLLNLVLHRNNFQFNNINYLQIKGVSMVSKVSPSFAILYMGWFEDTYVYPYQQQPLLFARYIDDIFMIWQHMEEELLSFINYLNTRVPNIEFTQEISKTEVNFLDVKVLKHETELTTTLYSKPTDSHDYILYSSAHPQRCKDSIPYSQFLRIRRICSNISDFEEKVLYLGRFFKDKGYPLELIQEAALLARRQDRNSLLAQNRPIDTPEQNNLFLITRYNPDDSTLKDLVFKNWRILGTSTSTSYIYQKKLMVGYRRPKNLRDLLVRAKIPALPADHLIESRPRTTEDPTPVDTPVASTSQGGYRQTTLDRFVVQNYTTPAGSSSNASLPTKHFGSKASERGFKFCNRTLCRFCKLLNKSGKITSHVTGEEHTTMYNISCRSSNLIYCISCKTCGKQYVGQTLRRLKDRLSEHLRDMDKADLTKPLGLHFTEHVDHPLEVHILEFIKKAPKSPQALIIRNRVEKRWIHLLRTPIPQGLNLED